MRVVIAIILALGGSSAIVMASQSSAPQSSEPVPPQRVAAGRACTPLLNALTDARVRGGQARPDAVRLARELIATYAVRGPERDGILIAAADELRAGGVTRLRRAELEARACVAIAGIAFDAGMTEATELRTYADARRKAVLPAPPPVETSPAISECVNVDHGVAKKGEPALLRNKCDYAVTAAYCMLQANMTSPTAEVACERGRYAVFQIKPRHAALLVLTDGGGTRYVACQVPFTPRIWWDSSNANTARGACEKE